MCVVLESDILSSGKTPRRAIDHRDIEYWYYAIAQQ